jgi:hypothetical protein
VAVVHDCEYAARLPDARGLLVAHFRIEPMPRRGCEHRIKAGVARLPGFEGAGDDLDPGEQFKIATHNRREILAELDAHDAASAPRKMPRSLPGAGANFQHCGIVLESAKREQVIEDLIGIVGTSLVVDLGVDRKSVSVCRDQHQSSDPDHLNRGVILPSARDARFVGGADESRIVRLGQDYK